MPVTTFCWAAETCVARLRLRVVVRDLRGRDLVLALEAVEDRVAGVEAELLLYGNEVRPCAEMP